MIRLLLKKIDSFISNRIVYTVTTLFSILMMCVVIIISYGLTYEKLRNESTQENYSWAVAKFVMKLSEFDVTLEHEIHSNNPDFDDINLKLDILFSRAKVIRDVSKSTEWLYREAEYKGIVDSIYSKLVLIDTVINGNVHDIKSAREIAISLRALSYKLANTADHAEVNQRDYNYQKYINAKSNIIVFSWWISIIGLVIFSLNLRQFFTVTTLLKDKKQAYENKNAFLGVLGHELRTSLQAIISSIDVLKMKGEGSESINILDRAASDMERQMRDLSEFAKVDNGIIELKNSRFNLSETLKDIIHEKTALRGREDLEIILDCHSDLIVVSDKFRVSQIVENLLTNAIKYTDSGSVVISASVSQGNFMITVKDTGCGIPTEKIDSIFSPFIRAHTDQIPGFGMGLAIVDGLVKRMDGTIIIDSELKVGTTFTIELPTGELNNSVEINQSVIKDDKNCNHINILVVDDNELVCETLKKMLLSAGYNVDSTTSPERALKKLLRKPFDVVLCDLQMPIMNGDVLYKSVKETPGPNNHTPFVFVTAYSDGPLPGNSIVIAKPARIGELNDVIRALGLFG